MKLGLGINKLTSLSYLNDPEYVDTSGMKFAEANSRGPNALSSRVLATPDLLTRMPILVTGDWKDITVYWVGYKQYQSSPYVYSEAPIGNDYTVVKHAIEGSGIAAPVFYGNNRTKVIKSGVKAVYAKKITAAQLGFGGGFIPSGTILWHKIKLTLPVGGFYPAVPTRKTTDYANSQNRRYDAANSTTSDTDTLGVFTWTGTAPVETGYSPLPVVIGTEYAGNNSLMVTGTSIDNGAWDGIVSSSYRLTPYGPGMHNMAAQDYNNSGNGTRWPIYNHGQNSSQVSGLVGVNSIAWREQVKRATVYISGHVDNDITNGANRTVASIQADKIAEWSLVKSLNPSIKIIAMDCKPRTSSSDSWTLNQTLLTGTLGITSAKALEYNSWLPTQKVAGNIDDYVSLEFLRDASNRDVWKMNGSAGWLTKDGYHPSTDGHMYASAVIRLAIYNVLGYFDAYYDPSDIHTLTMNGAEVVSVADKSVSRAYNITQSTPANRPTVTLAGTGVSPILMAALSADGTDELTMATALPFANGIDALFTIKPADISASRMIATGSLVAGSPIISIHSASGKILLQRAPSTALLYGTTTIVSGTNYIVGVRTNNTSVHMELGGVADGSATLDTTFTAGINRLLGRNGTLAFNGLLGRVVFLKPGCSAADRLSITKNLQLLAGF